MLASAAHLYASGTLAHIRLPTVPGAVLFVVGLATNRTCALAQLHKPLETPETRGMKHVSAAEYNLVASQRAKHNENTVEMHPSEPHPANDPNASIAETATSMQEQE